MNKGQFIVALVAGIIITIFFGLKTTHMDYPEHDYPNQSIDLSFYGKYIGSDISEPPYPTLGLLAYAGNCKYQVIIIALIIGILLVYTLKNKEII
ncbi:MAG: hypothetical protein NTW64_06465 [Candidatus Omnitrophica bacterium]|nr:hypothetical protein [Candidatus Omnitrophota bacterium]